VCSFFDVSAGAIALRNTAASGRLFHTPVCVQTLMRQRQSVTTLATLAARQLCQSDLSMISNKHAFPEMQHLNAEEIRCLARTTEKIEPRSAIRLSEAGFLRLDDIVGKPATKTSPGIPAIIPVSKSTWWAGVRTGRFPQPTRKLGARITAWSIESIRTLIEKTSTREA
jgi:predicted DNA-binding transcriptional regulator AlpA